MIFLFLFVSFCIIGIYNLNKLYESEYSFVKDKEMTVTLENSKFIDSYLSNKISIVEIISQKIVNEELVVQNKSLVKALALGNQLGNFADFFIGVHHTGDFIRANGLYKSIEKDNFDSRIRPWYEEANLKKSSGVSEPYVDKTTGKLVITVFNPIYKNEQLIGVVGADIFLDTVVENILNISINNVGFAYLVDSKGKTLIHKDKNMLNQQNKLFKQIYRSEIQDFGEAIDSHNSSKLMAYHLISIANWYLVVEMDNSTILEGIISKIFHDILLYLFLIIVINVVVYFALNKLLLPLKTFQHGLLDFFKYLNRELPHANLLEIKNNDEIGIMSHEVNANIKKIEQSIEEDRALIDETITVLSEFEQGDLCQRLHINVSNPALKKLKEVLNKMGENMEHNIDNVLNILEQYSNYNYLKKVDSHGLKKHLLQLANGVNDLGDSITSMLVENKSNGLTLDKSSDILLDNVNILNKNSTNTAASLEETAASLEEITSTIRENTSNVEQMTYNANELISSSKQGEVLATQTSNSMEEINTQVTAINEAITVIDKIAFQTNILSLNAAVEAATAGEAGKGFAVVAQEVRNLASRSAEAAKEIKDIVEVATKKANDGKAISSSMIEGYVNLNKNIESTIDIIQSVDMASKEQLCGIEQINDAVTQLDQQTQENVSIANVTHGVAVQTDKIAKLVVSNANAKEFDGKNDVKAKSVTSNTDEISINKADNKLKNKIIQSNTVLDDKEWESF